MQKGVGPSGKTYHLRAHTFNTTKPRSMDTAHGFETSGSFELKGTDVEAWSPQEWKGPAWEFDSVPCSAMQCSRKCKESAYSTTTMRGITYEDYCLCLAKCPGVTTDTPNWGDGCGFAWRYNLKTETQTSSTPVSVSPRTSTPAEGPSATTTDQSAESTRQQSTAVMTTSVASTAAVTSLSQPVSTGAANSAIPAAIQAAMGFLILL